MIDVLELLGDAAVPAHSSFVLTFSIDLPLYDGLLSRRLRQAGVINQLVFCDLYAYQAELAALSTTRKFGKAYSVTPVYQQAAFHPKLYLLLGRQQGRLLVGSGNATVGGLLRNAEVFGRFEYDAAQDVGPHPAFKETIQLIERIAAEASEVVRTQLAKARAWTPWLDREPVSDGRVLLVGGPGRPPLLDQILRLLNGTSIASVLICSSSFDRKLTALQRLAALARDRRVDCVVQPEIVQLDGSTVQQVGAMIDWHPFVDPYRPEKKKRRDVRAHAKLGVFDCGDHERAFYGSANASRPALLDQDGNTEVVVLLPPLPRGTVATQLGLEASLAAPSITDVLTQKSWPDEDEDRTGTRYGCVLTAAVPAEGRVVLTCAGSGPGPGAQLELAEGVHRPALLRTSVIVQGEQLIGMVGRVPTAARVARLVHATGQALSNTVGLTWPDVLHVHGSLGVGARTEAALAALHDGDVLGTVLFELLDHVRDFEVVFARSEGSRSKREQHPNSSTDTGEDRPSESFYTDTVPGEARVERWGGDRVDIDLLATLVQPLRLQGTRVADDGEDEADDSIMAEEAERRELDSKGARATGTEGREASFLLSRETLERARRRLERRLERAALSVEQALSHRKELGSIPSASVFRQIWMIHIAAFLAGRTTLSSDQKPVLCLTPPCFAHYVLRVCRALAGGRDGGLLALVPAEAWTGPDADTLRRGLAFLWTCAVWAAAFLAESRHTTAGNSVQAVDVWDAAPELVTARFVAAIRSQCPSPDTRDIMRRLPASETLSLGGFDAWSMRIERLADLLVNTEAADTPPWQGLRLDPASCRPGTLVYAPAVGITVLAGTTFGTTNSQKYQLVDLSSTKHPIRLFGVDAHVVGVPADSSLAHLTWRPPVWLGEQQERGEPRGWRRAAAPSPGAS